MFELDDKYAESDVIFISFCITSPLHHIQAYVFELDDEYAESDVPTTLIRSKADCPMMEVTTPLFINNKNIYLLFIII